MVLVFFIKGINKPNYQGRKYCYTKEKYNHQSQHIITAIKKATTDDNANSGNNQNWYNRFFSEFRKPIIGRVKDEVNHLFQTDCFMDFL